MGAFEKDGLLENVVARGEQLRAGLERIASESGCVQEVCADRHRVTRSPSPVARHSDTTTLTLDRALQVRGWGLILGMELTEECGFMASDVVGKLMEAGMLTVPAGLRVVRFVPPLVVTEKEVDEALEKVGEAFAALKK